VLEECQGIRSGDIPSDARGKYSSSQTGVTATRSMAEPSMVRSSTEPGRGQAIGPPRRTGFEAFESIAPPTTPMAPSAVHLAAGSRFGHATFALLFFFGTTSWHGARTLLPGCAFAGIRPRISLQQMIRSLRRKRATKPHAGRPERHTILPAARFKLDPLTPGRIQMESFAYIPCS